MWTKSFIQQQVEAIEERARFANDINKILESYSIADGVFGISRGNTYELSTGYFAPVQEFESINDAIRDMDQSSQAVRIVENKFILGNVYSSLSEIENENNIFSIEFLEDVK